MKPIQLVWVLPALLAPLALVFPWAAVPHHLGIAAADARFFLHWLTKYPNLGPINWEVGAGILCVLLSSALPFAYGVYVVRSRAPSRAALLGLTVATLAVYAPVLFRLDFLMWRYGVLPAPDALLGHPRLVDAVGAILRLLAVVDLCAVTVVAHRSPRAST